MFCTFNVVNPMPLNLIFLGAPGSGKGSVAKQLILDLKIPHISTGDILREEIKKGSDLGKKVQSIVSSGALVDDKTVADIIDKRILEKDCSHGFMLDGYPRTINQAKLLQEIMEKQKKKINAVISLNVPDGTIIKRLSGRFSCSNCGTQYNIYTLTPPKKSGICDSCGGKLIQRADDNLETVKKRLEIYKKDTQPLIDYYKEIHLLKEVTADGKIEENAAAVKKVLEL